MTAKFELKGHHRPVIRIRPDDEDQRILLAAFIRFDANSFYVSVERRENGSIDSIILSASDAQ